MPPSPLDSPHREFRAAYYGDCYQKGGKVSFVRKHCIINTGLNNARNVMAMDGVDYRSVYARCLQGIQSESPFPPCSTNN